jgi:hypothetical protein
MPNVSGVVAEHQFLGKQYLYCEGNPPLLFTENENNNKRLFGTTNLTHYVKDGINNYVVDMDRNAVNPAQEGTKMSANYQLSVPAKQSRTIKLANNLNPKKSVTKTYSMKNSISI